ncbi:MAG TPA: class I SAM-dependent methyltransferase [Bryobacteraceae bacterium]|jgi:cyclopropane fatty-acyl-phospholipid synthase-like methyltransferase|nr:class I SAM-dependent methyltransferase [Bryobacteraceae bacterium]
MRLLLVFSFAALFADAQKPVEEIVIETPFVTSPEQVVEAMLKLAAVKKGDVVYDLGCGDGRIVIAAAKQYGARGVGIDHNADLIAQAREKARQEGVESLVRFERGDIFDADIHEATVVAIYLLPHINLKLRPKLLKDLKPGARVVSHEFGMGDWKPEKTAEIDGAKILLWTIPPPAR